MDRRDAENIQVINAYECSQAQTGKWTDKQTDRQMAMEQNTTVGSRVVGRVLS